MQDRWFNEQHEVYSAIVFMQYMPLFSSIVAPSIEDRAEWQSTEKVQGPR